MAKKVKEEKPNEVKEPEVTTKGDGQPVIPVKP
jgi:hypothetical protein